MTKKISKSFPPVQYSTAFVLREELMQYLNEEGTYLAEENGLSVIIEKPPVDQLLCSNLYASNNVKKCRSDEHSLLKFLALNALELAAPASDAILRHPNGPKGKQQQQQPQQQPPQQSEMPTKTTTTAVTATATATSKNTMPWCQLSGHPDCFSRAGPGTIWKKCSGGTEGTVYDALSSEPQLKDIVPRYLREVDYAGEKYIELQDLLHSFRDPYVMDIKMGTRTFLESEVQNTFGREDLYLKMIAIDPTATTVEENAARKVTKLRYMQFREQQSSTSTLGFRIEAMKFRGSKPVTDLKKVKSKKEVIDTLSLFLGRREEARQRLISRLADIRTKLEQSQYFKTNEIVGSSILIIYDDVKVGAWLIDFAKTRPVPANISLTHRLPWSPGNHEDGFLYGLDQLINIIENIQVPQNVTAESTAPSSVVLTS